MNSSTVKKTFLLENSSDSSALEIRLLSALKQRIAESEELNVDEINDVSKKNVSLFEKGYVLDKEQYKSFSILCRLSRCGLEQSPSKASHRKLIGPLIDFGKKVLFRILDSRYGKKFDAIEEFNMWLVANQANMSSQLAPKTRDKK